MNMSRLLRTSYVICFFLWTSIPCEYKKIERYISLWALRSWHEAWHYEECLTESKRSLYKRATSVGLRKAMSEKHCLKNHRLTSISMQDAIFPFYFHNTTPKKHISSLKGATFRLGFTERKLTGIGFQACGMRALCLVMQQLCSHTTLPHSFSGYIWVWYCSRQNVNSWRSRNTFLCKLWWVG